MRAAATQRSAGLLDALVGHGGGAEAGNRCPCLLCSYCAHPSSSDRARPSAPLSPVVNRVLSSPPPLLYSCSSAAEGGSPVRMPPPPPRHPPQSAAPRRWLQRGPAPGCAPSTARSSEGMRGGGSGAVLVQQWSAGGRHAPMTHLPHARIGSSGRALNSTAVAVKPRQLTDTCRKPATPKSVHNGAGLRNGPKQAARDRSARPQPQAYLLVHPEVG